VPIIGHADAKGALDYNQDLSVRRAKAVVAALTSDYGIAAERLSAVGVSMAAPVGGIQIKREML
jgi:outer membrane protein OmpA-like peptidoglycan-associated protein